jgi:hypothetical protein
METAETVHQIKTAINTRTALMRKLGDVAMFMVGVVLFVWGGFNGKFLGLGLNLLGIVDYAIADLALMVGQDDLELLARLERIEKMLANSSSASGVASAQGSAS